MLLFPAVQDHHINWKYPPPSSQSCRPAGRESWNSMGWGQTFRITIFPFSRKTVTSWHIRPDINIDFTNNPRTSIQNLQSSEIQGSRNWAKMYPKWVRNWIPLRGHKAPKPFEFFVFLSIWAPQRVSGFGSTFGSLLGTTFGPRPPFP